MTTLSKIIVTVITFFVGILIMAAGAAVSPMLRPILGFALIGAITAIWRSKPPKKDDYQLKKD